MALGFPSSRGCGRAALRGGCGLSKRLADAAPGGSSSRAGCRGVSAGPRRAAAGAHEGFPRRFIVSHLFSRLFARVPAAIYKGFLWFSFTSTWQGRNLPRGAAGCLSGALAGCPPKEMQPVTKGFRDFERQVQRRASKGMKQCWTAHLDKHNIA